MPTKTNRKSKPKKHADWEDAAFPVEFLDVIAETAFDTLWRHLRKAGQPKEAALLLDAFYSICIDWAAAGQNDGKLSEAENSHLQEIVARATRLIVKLGGEFLTPSGPVRPDEVSHV